MGDVLRIAVLGDFNPEFHSHVAANEAYQHSATSLGFQLEAPWIPTPEVTEANVDQVLGSFHGIWVAAGSPYRSMAGALAAIRFARTRGWPFYAT